MPAFVYEAVTERGRRVTGRAEAPDVGALARTLESKGLLVLDVEAPPAGLGTQSFRFRWGRRREVLEVTRAMASLLPAGMPLAQALGAASNMATGPVAEAVAAVRGRVERGEPLAEALAQNPELFSAVYVGLVRAGEKSGDLATVFRGLATQLEREEALKAKVVSASIYPILLALLGGIAITLLMVFVIPRFATLLQDAGAVLPRSTALLLTISEAVRSAWPVLLAIPLMVLGAVAWVRGSESGRRATTFLALRLPLVRAFKRNVLAAEFARMTGTLVSGGASLVTALDDSITSLANPVARDETVRIRTRVREGSSLNGAIAEGILFPRLLSQLVAVGEESSRLPEFLLKAAEIFEDKTSRAMERLVTVAEPLMIVVFGSMVALVALSLLQAIYGVNAGSFR